ncbi:MAG: CvpA family protein [Muribaculaceae bacterium]|nr:CvpA family protein [Muribaculaceae bacterium]
MIIVIAAAAVWGFWKGFIQQAGSIAAIVVGIVACRMLGHQAVVLIMPEGPSGAGSMSYYAVVAGVYSAMYIVAYYAVLLVAKMLKLAVHTVFLGPLDRIGGAIFNIAKCLIMVSFLLNLYLVFFPKSDIRETSGIAGGKFVSMVIDLGPSLVGAVTSESE